MGFRGSLLWGRRSLEDVLAGGTAVRGAKEVVGRVLRGVVEVRVEVEVEVTVEDGVDGDEVGMGGGRVS